jgi:hypothetical protein
VRKPRPVIPPPGWYDPALEAQRRASTRGLGDLRQDTELAGSRAAQDYTFGVTGLQTSRDRGYQDVDRQVALLTRGYGQLARQQAEGDAQAGVINPAIAAKQMQIRAANMAFDRQPLDVERGRIGQDYSTGVGRLGVDYTRGGVDRATGLARAGRENTQFGLDIGEQERFQAIQAGWAPPPVPGAHAGPHVTAPPDPRKRRRATQTWRAGTHYGPSMLRPVGRFAPFQLGGR